MDVSLARSFVVAALAVCPAAPAAALDYSITIVNETGFDIVGFYASRVGSDASGENRLASESLKPGEQTLIDLNDGKGYCMFDFRAVFSDDDELVDEGINICEVGVFPYKE